MKRIEKIKARVASGKRKKKTASAKYIKGVLSAVQHVSATGKDKIMEDRGFDDGLRTSGKAPIGRGNYSKVRYNKDYHVVKKKGRRQSLGGGVKSKGRGKGRSKSLGAAPQGKNYGSSADIFSEDNPFAGVSFG